jgi:putative amidoligase enzyme
MIRYQIVTSKPKIIPENEKRMIHGIYLVRQEAAKLHKFSPEAGKKIHELRLAYFKSVNPSKKLTDKKYGIEFEYNPTQKERLLILTQYKQRVKKIRREMREIPASLTQTGFDDTQKIHVKPNGVFNWFSQKLLTALKIPTTSDSYIGVEIECGVPQDMDYTIFQPWAKKINVGSDGSISELPAGYVSKEFRFLTTVQEYKEDITQLYALLNKHKVVVNHTCGLHVHLDMRAVLADRQLVAQKFVNLVKSQKYLQLLVTPDRVLNHFCLPNTNPDPFSETGRYRAINPTSLGRHGTLEIRLHHGSLDSQEVTSWIALLLAIIEAEPITRTPAKVDSFLSKLELETSIKEYIKEKIARAMSERTPTVCTIEHSGESCSRCTYIWSHHSGHNCSDGRRGQFNCDSRED